MFGGIDEDDKLETVVNVIISEIVLVSESGNAAYIEIHCSCKGERAIFTSYKPIHVIMQLLDINEIPLTHAICARLKFDKNKKVNIGKITLDEWVVL